MKTPSHYDFEISPWQLIRNLNMSFDLGNVVKYVCRYPNKNQLEDLQKALNYARSAKANPQNFNYDEAKYEEAFTQFVTVNRDKLNVDQVYMLSAFYLDADSELVLELIYNRIDRIILKSKKW